MGGVEHGADQEAAKESDRELASGKKKRDRFGAKRQGRLKDARHHSSPRRRLRGGKKAGYADGQQKASEEIR